MGQPPVAVGEEIDVRIDSVGEKGDGIARKKGFILFVPNTKAGEYVKIKVTKVLPKVGFAQVVEKLEAPPADAQPSRARTVRKDDFDESILDTSKDSDSFGEEESAPEEAKEE
jgi:predicted RNA-binding protein with TRAM domain